MASGDTKTEALLNVLGNGGDASQYVGCCNTKTQQYILDAINRVQGVQDEVDDLKNNPDVVDIVDAYQDLEDYDTSGLTDKDIIRVLQDETHSGNSTYYRWNATTNQFDFVGEIAGGGGGMRELTSADYNWNFSLNSATEPYDAVALWLLEPGIYYKTATSGLIVAVHANPGGIETLGTGTYIVAFESSQQKQIVYTTANSPRIWNRQLVTVSNGVSAGTGEFLMSDLVVQATGNSTTYVMSQNATTSMVFADPENTSKVRIGDSSSIGNSANYGIAIGTSATTNGDQATAVGYSSQAVGEKSLALGRGATANPAFSVALGAGATPSSAGEIDISTGQIYPTRGYNGTNYRLISGVHDPVNAHDAATKGYVDANTGSGVKVLTSADYNYPENNPTSIALWLLDEGQYQISANTVYCVAYGTTSTDSTSFRVEVYLKPTSNSRGTFATIRSAEGISHIYYGIDRNGNNGSERFFTIPVINNLTNMGTAQALSAYQGKVLKDLIDALDVRVSALEGN